MLVGVVQNLGAASFGCHLLCTVLIAPITASYIFFYFIGQLGNYPR